MGKKSVRFECISDEYAVPKIARHNSINQDIYLKNILKKLQLNKMNNLKFYNYGSVMNQSF